MAGRRGLVDYLCFDLQPASALRVPPQRCGVLVDRRDSTRADSGQRAISDRKALDLGAWRHRPAGVEPEEAAAAVAACRYPPTGVRSYGPTRLTGDRDADPNRLNERRCAFHGREQRRLDCVEAIAATPDLTHTGPSDLASRWTRRRVRPPDHISATERIPPHADSRNRGGRPYPQWSAGARTSCPGLHVRHGRHDATVLRQA